MNLVGEKFLKLWTYGALARRVFTKIPVFGEIRENIYLSWWSSAAKELGADITELKQGYYRISKGDKSTVVKGHLLNIDTYMNLMLVGDKPFVHGMLQSSGYKVPRYTEYDLSSMSKASAFMNTVGGRCVVKPSGGSGGFGVTTGVDSRKRLWAATVASGSASYRQKPMIEEEIEGDSYRLLFLDGKLIDAVKRCRPTVVGDGKSTIRQLIDSENKERLGSGPSRSFSLLTVDLDSKFFLEDKGMKLHHVPSAGEIVAVKNVANQNSNRDNSTVRDDVHPYFHSLGQGISSILGIKLVGVDVMARDITVPLDESGGVINEINIPPGLHYHELIANPEKKANVCLHILDYIFSGAKLDFSVATSSLGDETLDRMCM